ncbi:hypothetical protein FVEN_g6630 [Fusarium venenatum]|nr:hypothetical protein FVEN_g6630 [Fusarium venenatum]
MDSGVFSMYRMLCGLLVFCPLVLGHTGHHHLHKRHHQHSHHHDGMEARSDISISDAESAVEKALAALAEINKARVDHPSFNKYEMVEDSDLSLAGPLDYSSNSTKAKRDTGAAPYVIPSELQDAARTLAESKPQKPSGDHAQVAARIKAKYDHKNNDTNSPDPLDRPDGRLGEFGPDSKQKVMERAAGYWTVDMPQLGLAPYAPKGYKASVRRNVKDFGTKGDGKTDDTAAINRAISDGQRCGPECGASTKVPAVI